MFVRTKKGKIFDCVVSEQMGKPIYYPKNSETNGYIDWYEVYKKSENIIDILEVGDYVNGGQVREKTKEYIRINSGNFLWEYLEKEQDIKSIVTKEMFSSIEYRIGSEE